MSDLTAFLNARIDEAEEAEKVSLAGSGPWTLPQCHRDDDVRHIVRHDPVRVLREVEAKQNILARYEDCLTRQEDQDYPYAPAAEQAREYEDFVLPNLAASYSDHPDYDPDWKP